MSNETLIQNEVEVDDSYAVYLASRNAAAQINNDDDNGTGDLFAFGAAQAATLAAAPEIESEVIFGLIPATDKIEEALTFGGLDYEVEAFDLKPVLTGIVDLESPEPEADWQVPGFCGIRRADDRKIVFTVMHDTYQIVQNRAILEYIAPLLEATGGTFTRVGSLMGGAQIFAFLTLSEKITLPGGLELNQNLLISSSHDGSHCLRIAMVATTADGTIVKKGHAYDLRHTRNVHIKMTEVVRIMEIKNSFFRDLTLKMTNLSERAMSDNEANIWIEKFLEFPTQADISVNATKTAAKDRILKAFRQARAGGNTRLAMALAVAHDRSHGVPAKRTKKFQSQAESRFRGLMNGTSANELAAAWDELLTEEPAV